MKEKRTIKTVQKSISAFFRENRRMLSFSEMVDLLGVRSKSVVNFWIDKLIAAEILEKEGKGHLTFTKSTIGLPMAGSVQAGFPSPEEEALCDIMSMDEYLISGQEYVGGFSLVIKNENRQSIIKCSAAKKHFRHYSVGLFVAVT